MLRLTAPAVAFRVEALRRHFTRRIIPALSGFFGHLKTRDNAFRRVLYSYSACHRWLLLRRVGIVVRVTSQYFLRQIALRDWNLPHKVRGRRGTGPSVLITPFGRAEQYFGSDVRCHCFWLILELMTQRSTERMRDLRSGLLRCQHRAGLRMERVQNLETARSAQDLRSGASAESIMPDPPVIGQKTSTLVGEPNLFVCAYQTLWLRVHELKPERAISIPGPSDGIPLPTVPGVTQLRLAIDEGCNPSLGYSHVPGHYIRLLLRLLGDWKTGEKLLAHCWAGASRSTAVARIALSVEVPFPAGARRRI